MELNDLTAKFVITVTKKYLLLYFKGNSLFCEKTGMGVAGQHAIDEKIRRLKKLLTLLKLLTNSCLRPINNRQRRAPYSKHNLIIKITTSHPNRLHII